MASYLSILGLSYGRYALNVYQSHFASQQPYGRREYDVIIAQCHITSTIDNYGSVKLEGVPVGDTPVRNTQLI